MSERRNRLLLPAVVLLVLAAVAFWLLGGDGPTASSAATAPTRPAGTATPLAAEAPESPQAAERAEVAAPQPASKPETDPRFAHVRGRCVDGSGAPLRGCKAKFSGGGGNQNRVAMQGKVDWHDPEPVVTGDDGHFDIAFVPPSGLQFFLDVQAEGRVPRTARWGTIEPAQMVDLGDVRLVAGFEVHGRVVDEHGFPVAKAGVTVNSLPLPLAPDMAANDSRHGVSKDDGAFAITVMVPPGTWPIDVSGRGLRLVSPDHVVVTDRGAEPLTVVVRRMPSIEGVVVDEQGAPVEHVYLEAEINRSGRSAAAWSRADGTFVLYAVDAEPVPIRIVVDDPGPCEPSWHDDRLWEWGSRDVRVILKRALSLELTVVERRTGAPVTQYAVRCHSVDAHSSLNTDLRLGGEHAEGRVTVDKIWRGKNVVQVTPIDQTLLPSEVVEFEATDAGVAPIRVELDRLQHATVRATTADGKPVAGSKVEVVKKGTQPFDATAYVQESRSGSRGFSSDPKYRFHELASAAQTGADGRAEVFVPTESSGLAVRITGQHPPAILDPAVFPTGQDLAVLVPEGGGITGKVTLVGYETGRVSIALQRSDGQPRRANPGEGALQGDGSFAVRGLAPGVYQLKLQYSAPLRTEHGSSGGDMPLPLDVPDVTVQAGRDTEVEIDATAVAPATVRGRLLVDGAPPAMARAFLWLERGIQFGQFVPDSTGTFLATGLPPGTWRAGIVLGDFTTSEGDRVVQDETFTLAAGQELSREFAFLRRRLVVTIVKPDGKTPVAELQLFANGERYHKQCATDEHGRLVFDPAPSGKIDLHPMTGGKLEPVEMPEGKAQHEVTVTFTPPPPSK